MNRIRAAYFERVPEVRRYFVMPGNGRQGMRPGGPWAWTSGSRCPWSSIASAPAIIGVLNAVVAGSIGAMAAAIQSRQRTPARRLVVGVIVFVALFVAQTAFGQTRGAPRPDPSSHRCSPQESANDAE